VITKAERDSAEANFKALQSEFDNLKVKFGFNTHKQGLLEETFEEQIVCLTRHVNTQVEELNR